VSLNQLRSIDLGYQFAARRANSVVAAAELGPDEAPQNLPGAIGPGPPDEPVDSPVSRY
jgi:hypothetical protein